MTLRTWVACNALAGILVMPAAAQAAVIDFDTVTGGCGISQVPNGYAGMNWNNIFVLAADLCGGNHAGSGYDTGTISEEYVAFNGNGAPAATSSGVFTYNGAYYTGAWRDGLNVTVKGFLGLSELFSDVVVVNTDAPFLHLANWAGIDRITWQASGGVQDPTLLNGAGTQFVMDDLMINEQQAVPEPATLLLLGTGLVSVARRQRRAGR
jgi:hypothetical protein